MNISTKVSLLIGSALLAFPVCAQKINKPKSVESIQALPWMSTEVGQAWASGFRGQGVTITVVDDFRSRSRYDGDLSVKEERLRHGEWTLKQSSLIAPSAKMVTHDFNSGKKVNLNAGLNVLNLSYSMNGPSSLSSFRWSAQEKSIISHARNGLAVISKAAGNDYGLAIGQPSTGRQLDFLNKDLIGAQSAIFVGALSTHGTVENPASMADYSNIAGQNVTVQNHFLVVGVDAAKTNLYGTSFAAPTVSGYAAIVGSKFTKASATQVVNQLLNTARTDTIRNYDPNVHGKGEASVSRALAPVSIR